MTVRKRLFAFAMCVLMLAGMAAPVYADEAAAYTCGKTEHSHSELCQPVSIVCGRDGETSAEHTAHDSVACYSSSQKLVCTIEENHVHDPACFTTPTTLICTNTEADHVHTGECYTYGEPSQICTIEENHTHSEACYVTEKNLICIIHVHEDACYSHGTCSIEEHVHNSSCLPTPSCTCNAQPDAQGAVTHVSPCPLYVAPSCTCNAQPDAQGVVTHVSPCPLYVAPTCTHDFEPWDWFQDTDLTDGVDSSIYYRVYPLCNQREENGAPAEIGALLANATSAEEYRAALKQGVADGVLTQAAMDYILTSMGIMPAVNQASVNGTEYATLKEALDAANGQTVTLLANVEKFTYDVMNSKSVKIDLNGYTISAENYKWCFRVAMGGSIEVSGTGTLKETTNYYAPILFKAVNTQHSVITIGQGVTLEGWTGIMIDKNGNSGTTANLTINMNGTVNSH